MDRASKSGVADKGGVCQISFTWQGERYRVTIRGHLYENKTHRRQAAQIRASVLHDIALGTFYFPKWFPDHPKARSFRKGFQIPLADALKDWLKQKRPSLEPTTYKGYQTAVIGNLLPKFGSYRLSELQTSDVESWLASLATKGKTKNNVLIPLRAVYAKAFRDGLIERDPLARIPNVAHKQREPNPLTRPEIEALLNACEGQIRNIIEFAIWTGMRTSELIAIRWQDIDIPKKKIHVRITRTNLSQKDHGKTVNALRSIDLNQQSLNAVERQRQFTSGKEFVFDNPRTNEPWKHDGPYRKIAWTPAIKRAGLIYRNPYQSRHTFASLLLSAGCNPMYVAQQMGHKDWGMIRKVYGRFMPDFSEAETAKIATIWAPDRHHNYVSL